jgi:hypothetical protein
MTANEPPFNSRRVVALWALGIGAGIVGLALWAVILL